MGFGKVLITDRNLVPNPPARIITSIDTPQKSELLPIFSKLFLGL
jgi:hypothetical protein